MTPGRRARNGWQKDGVHPDTTSSLVGERASAAAARLNLLG